MSLTGTFFQIKIPFDNVKTLKAPGDYFTESKPNYEISKTKRKSYHGQVKTLT